MLLVAAKLMLADGSVVDGFLTPAFVADDDGPETLGTIQPELFLPSGEIASFWEGMFERPEQRLAIYAGLARPADRIFPIRFEAVPGLATGVTSGRIQGF